MKKKIFIAMTLLLGLILVACNNTNAKEPEPDIIKYTITFDGNGGRPIIIPVEVEENGLIPEPDEITRAGYDFLGWFTDTDVKWIFNEHRVTGPMELTAKWQPIGDKYYTVTFSSEGEAVINPETLDVLEGTTIKAPTAEREGYRFIGWFADQNLTDEWNFTTSTVNEAITLYAKWEAIEYIGVEFISDDVPTVVSVEKGLKVSAPVINKPGYDLVGWYTDQSFTHLYDFNNPVNEELTLYAYWIEEGTSIPIDSEVKLLNLFANGGSRKYVITKDLDFSEYNVSGSEANFSGELDGGGHTIRNLNVQSSANKQGAFFKRLTDDGIIKNIRITNSSINFGGNGEGTGFLVHAAWGNAAFRDIEFVNVKVNSEHSYSALVFADNANDPNQEGKKVLDNIIVRNNLDHKIVGNTYTGGLVGHIRVAANLDISNVYFQGHIEATGQMAGMLIGRIQNGSANIKINSVVVKGTINNERHTGALIGGGASGTSVIIDSVVIQDFDINVTNNSFALLVGNPNGLSMTIGRVYYNNTSIYNKEVIQPITEGTLIEKDNITSSWLYTIVGLSHEFFKAEDGVVKLNREEEPLEADSISLTGNVKNLYQVGEELDLTGLSVLLNYNDGSSTTLQAEEYEVNTENFDNTTEGLYEIIITYENFSRVLTVQVVTITEVIVHTIEFIDLYKIGKEVNLANIYLHGKLSNGDIIVLDTELYDYDLTNINKEVAGKYLISVSFGELTPIEIPVYYTNILEETNDIIELVIDKDLDVSDGSVSNNQVMVSSFTRAFRYLKEANYADSVKKVIYVEPGYYYEKPVLDIPNVTIVGSSREDVILAYYSGAGNIKPSGSGTWGTQGSAVLSIKSNAFNVTVANMTIINEFDYYNETVADKQGVAMVNEADKALFYQVTFKGIQDTLYAKSGRQWYLNNYIEGAVDYIFGNGGPAFFEDNTIHTIYRSNANGVIATNQGENNTNKPLDYAYVFYNNMFTTDNTSRTVDLGRPWRPIARISYINNTFQNGMTLGWTEMSGNKPENAFFSEYENRYEDESLVPYNSVADTLTEAEAQTLKNKDIIFGTTNGGDSFSGVWDYEAQLQFLINKLS